MVVLQVCPTQRSFKTLSEATECQNQKGALMGFTPSCAIAGRRLQTTDPPLNTWRMSWRTFSLPQRGSTISYTGSKRHTYHWITGLWMNAGLQTFLWKVFAFSIDRVKMEMFKLGLFYTSNYYRRKLSSPKRKTYLKNEGGSRKKKINCLFNV